MDKVQFGGEVSSVVREGLEEMIRGRMQSVLASILEEELDVFLAKMSGQRCPDGKAAVVRNGHHPERTINTGAGPLAVKVPRTRNRLGGENFRSVVIPAYKRSSATFEEAVCYLYLKGVSTGDMSDALGKMFGDAAGDVSPATVTRLTRRWQDEFIEWNKRSLADKDYCYMWVDGIHFSVRVGEEKLCTLVVIGATRDGVKELVAVEGGYRESAESWAALLRGLRARGMGAPKLFVGDGALGFWKAAGDVYPTSRCQLCWVHKTANVLDKLPKKLQPKAKGMIRDIYAAETKADAIGAYKRFVEVFEAKYPRAVASIEDNFDELFAFYDFPAEHWRHIRTTNPIESTFATVRLRTKSTRGNGSMDTTLAMAFKLVMEASRGWRAMNGAKLILKLYDPLVKFVDGVERMAA